MKWKLVNDGPQRTFVVVLGTGDEAFAGLRRFIGEQRLGAAQITAIGAFASAVVGYFDWTKKQYKRIPVDEQVEVVSLVGDIALDPNGEPTLHAHAGLRSGDPGQTTIMRSLDSRS